MFLQCLYKLQGLSLQYLHKAIITVLCLLCLYKNISIDLRLLLLLQISLQMSLREDILHHLYKGISTIMRLLLSLHISLRSEFLQPSLLVSLRSEIIQLSVLTSLPSKFVLSALWKLFLRRLYKDILTVTDIPSKP